MTRPDNATDSATNIGMDKGMNKGMDKGMNKGMDKGMDYGMRRTVKMPYDEAVVKTKTVLQEQGFGVLSEIDMKEKLKEKLGVDVQRYVILGACNPPLAYKALQAEPEIGLLLPCNVIVYETGPGESVVAAVDPDAMLSVMANKPGDNPAIAEVGRDARQRLEAALRALE